MIRIKKIELSRLHKIEVPILLRSVIEILEKHNPETLRFKDMHALLVAQMDKAKILFNDYGAHKLTDQIQRLHDKRLKNASLIHMQIETLEKLDCKKTQAFVEDAIILSKAHLTYLGQMRQDQVDAKIYSFFSELKHDTDKIFQDAFAGLGLLDYVEQLEKTNNAYDKLYIERLSDMNNRPSTSDRILERETQKIMRMFFEQVNFQQDLFSDIKYGPFIYNMNLKLTEFSKTIKTRKATNKRRARKKALAAQKEAEGKEIKDGAKLKTSVVIKPTKKLDDKPTPKDDQKQ